MNAIERMKTIENFQLDYEWMLSEFLEGMENNILSYYKEVNSMLDFTMLFEDSLTIEKMYSNMLKVRSKISNEEVEVIIPVHEEDNLELVIGAIKELYNSEVRETIMYLINIDVNKVIDAPWSEAFEEVVEDVQDDILMTTKYNLVYDDIYPRIVDGVIERLG